MKQKIAIISDIHGNSFALEAVLKDISHRNVDLIFNLGDSIYGPLDPVGTIKILKEHKMNHVRGNCDRMLWEPVQDSSSTLNEVKRLLTNEHLNWLKEHPSQYIMEDIFFCHGTPDSDEIYLLEKMTEDGGVLKTTDEIMKHLQNIEQQIIVCGHTHIPRVVYLPDGKIVVNPGSIGLPAYKDDLPISHKMESGSPLANYAVLEKESTRWIIEQISVPYDWEKAAESAEKNGREDWAVALRTGRVEI
ncbi:metallophosphoesterase family protein [Bacillus arachidis]|uniref:Phosphoesterase n=3 Tax=Bacillus TaxID=1386 RepID=A0ABS3P648_9BACI|nr:metallophosphoesterase family protein [Bacillus arachidis]MBO1628275.1 metallophosphoesterase family protein [Bacillus arachidis]